MRSLLQAGILHGPSRQDGRYVHERDGIQWTVSNAIAQLASVRRLVRASLRPGDTPSGSRARCRSRCWTFTGTRHLWRSRQDPMTILRGRSWESGHRLPGWPGGLTGRASAVIGSVAFGCLMQGGFYSSGRAGVLALVLCAAVLTTWRESWDLTDRRLTLTSVVVIAWAVLNGAVRGSWLDAVPASATVVAFTLMFLVARRLSGDERRTASVGVVAVGWSSRWPGCGGLRCIAARGRHRRGRCGGPWPGPRTGMPLRRSW